MTAELNAEWAYLYQERLGIFCGADEPTAEQRAIAKTEADQAVQELSVDPSAATATPGVASG